MPDSVVKPVVRHVTERPHLSTWEASERLRELGIIDCTVADVRDWARAGVIEAYKYNGRWRILSLDWLPEHLNRLFEGQEDAGK
jgi:hypothetical protein